MTDSAEPMAAVRFTLIATLGGFLFGYDTAVISGAVAAIDAYFVDPMSLSETLAGTLSGLTISSALFGCVLGGLIAGRISDALGRRGGLILAALLFLCSAIGSAMPELGLGPIGGMGPDALVPFIAYRVLGGVGIGLASMLSPLYIAEIAPREVRGRLVSYNQMAIVLGIVGVYFVNWSIARQGDEAWVNTVGWRWMLASEAIPALLFALLLLTAPETPRWMAMKGRTQAALLVLHRLVGARQASVVLAEIETAVPEAGARLLRFGAGVVIVGVLLSVGQQFVGINAVLYYAPLIFRNMGLGGESALLQTVIVGTVNAVFTLVAIFTVDRLGRRPLLIAGALIMAGAMALLALMFQTHQLGFVAMTAILVYVAAFAFSWGPVVWVLLSEMFPAPIRSRALAIAVTAQWIANLGVSWSFKIIDGSSVLNAVFNHSFAYWLYALMSVLAALLVWRFVPETRGRSLEAMHVLWVSESRTDTRVRLAAPASRSVSARLPPLCCGAILILLVVGVARNPAYAEEDRIATTEAEPVLFDTIPVEAAGNVVTPDERRPSRPRVIDEVIVTAQKREQADLDVPISMSVIADDFIAEQALTDIRDVLLFVPNFSFNTTTFFATPNCRGFKINNLNRAFESPCGLALDGIPYGRSAYFQAALLDIQRVEVLRGPQGTTFGKNTTAGLVHAISKEPTEEFTGYADVQFGELDHRRVEAAVGGRLIPDALQFRVAALSEKRDGFVRNTTAAIVPEAPDRPLNRQREGFRVKLAAPDLFGTSLQLTYEEFDLTSAGVGWEMYDVKPEVAAFIRAYDPGADFVKDNLVVSEDYPSSTALGLKRYQADWKADVVGWNLVAVAAHGTLDTTVELDTDNTPAPLLESDLTERSPTTTFEIRTLSPSFEGLFGLDNLFGRSLGASDLLAGFFYQRRDMKDSRLRTRTHDLPLAVQILLGNPSFNSPLPPALIEALPLRELVELLGLLGVPDITEEVDATFNQKAETFAGFAELQWHLSERWMLQYGMRFSRETKDASWDQRLSQPHPLLTVAGFEAFAAERSMSESQFQPKFTLSYKPDEDVSLFAHWTRGFKGGGFNAFLFKEGDERSPMSFDPEIATEWGIDAKMKLLGGAMRLNLSLYRLDVDDFQVFTFVPEPTTNINVSSVVNAATARAQGLELDLTWLATDWLTIIGTVGFNDTEFLDFPIGPCTEERPNTDGDDDPRCDLSGKPFPYAPRWNNTLTAALRQPLGIIGLHDVDFTLGTTVEYISSQYLNDAVDPIYLESSFYRFKASIGFASSARGWSFRVTGENLSDERPSTNLGRTGGISKRAPEPPRLVVSQFRWEF